MWAEQILAIPHGLVWRASVGGWLRMVGYDAYDKGQGRMKWRLLGLVPLINADGPDISRSARGRLAAEAIWLPSALLPQRGAQWELVSDEVARVILTIDDEPVTLTLTIAPDGALKKIQAMRWGDQTDDGHYAEIPFGGEVLEEKTFGGYTVPVRMGAGSWVDTERYFEFFRPEILETRFR